MIKRSISILLSFIMVFSLFLMIPENEVSAAASGTGYYRISTSGSSLRIRTTPSTDAAQVGTVPNGVTVNVTEVSSNWGKTTYNGVSGWISLDYATKVDGSASASTDTASILAKLDELRKKFPDGKYWNHYGSSKANPDGWTNTPCPSGHFLNGVQQCNGQCDGFARKLGLDLFGLSTYSWNKTTYNINTVCVGDIIRYNSKHTIMVVGFTSDPNTLIIADCNWDYHCGISWDRSFSTSRYFSTVNWVMHYPGNNFTREVYLNGGATAKPTTTTTAATTAATTTTTAAQKLTVTADKVNVRTGAGAQYSRITSVDSGAVFTVLGSAKDSEGKLWYKISVDGKTGYIISTYVKLSSTTTTTKKPTTTTTASGGTLTAKSDAGAYASPTKSAAKSATMKKGEVYSYTSVYVGGDNVKWYLVTVGTARGWVCSSDVTLGGTLTTTTKKTTTKTSSTTTKKTTSDTTTSTKKPTTTTKKPTTTTTTAAKTLTAKSAAGAYASPTKSAVKSATMKAGATYKYTSVYVGGDNVKWYLVTVGTSTGWVCSSDVTLNESTTTTKKPTTTTTAASGNTLTAKSAAGAYASPTKSAAKSATMKAGATYKYTNVYVGGDNVKWYLVTVGTSTGWVCSSDVTLNESTTTTKKPTTTTTAASGNTLTAKSAAGAYASPTKSAAKSATMKAGTVYKYTSVYVGGDKVKWYLVTVGTSTGWVCSSDVTLNGSTTTTTTASEKTLTAKSAAGAYASPTKSAAKSATMKAGATYKYTNVYVGGDNVKWYLVTVGTATGWVCSSDVKL